MRAPATGGDLAVVIMLGVIAAVVLCAALVELGIWHRGHRRWGPNSDPAPLLSVLWLALAVAILVVMRWALGEVGKD